jgi:hypothetical protein
MVAGQVTAGGVISFTIILKEQLGPAEDVAVTVVAPTGKKEPET